MAVDRPAESKSLTRNGNPPRRIVSLSTEDIAWKTLDDLVSKRISATEIELDFSEAKWARVHLVFGGDPFHQTVTPSVMKGIVEFQNSFYHAISLFLNNDPRTSRLSYPERDELELIFKVSDGSSDLDAPADGILTTVSQLGAPLVKGLGSYQKMVVIIALALLFASTWSLPKYLDFVKDTKKSADDVTAHQSDNEREMSLHQLASKYTENDQEKFRIFADAVKSVRSIRAFEKESNSGYSSLMKQSYRANSLTVQGRSVSKTQMNEIVRRTRRSSEDVTFRALYTIETVDTTTENGFLVSMKNIQTGEIVYAILEERLAKERYGRTIQRAEWSKSSVSVMISGRRIGDQLKDGRILSASVPRQTR